RQRGAGGGERVHVVGFEIGRLVAVELVAVERGDAALVVAPRRRQHPIGMPVPLAAGLRLAEIVTETIRPVVCVAGSGVGATAGATGRRGPRLRTAATDQQHRCQQRRRAPPSHRAASACATPAAIASASCSTAIAYSGLRLYRVIT